MKPLSCDTFVVMANLTKGGSIIFGKNSDRPNGEVQEIVYQKRCNYPLGTKLKATYIEIEQCLETYTIILSKPSWMWGAEMGANEHGVCVGNEAIWSEIDANKDEKLLGMDLVRLSLERSKTAFEALMTITSLLEKYGQGGSCSDRVEGLFYHNSYLIADKNEAWVLETVDKMWGAEKITEGYRNISNCLSIGCKIDLMSDGLKEEAKKLGLWNGLSEFNFKNVFGTTDCDVDRFNCGQTLLGNLTKESDFSVKNMCEVLRTAPIARGVSEGFPSTGSQISQISQMNPAVHWFTGTPDPRESIFKPFIFSLNSNISKDIQSAVIEKAYEQKCSKLSKSIDRSHTLYRLHETTLQHKNEEILDSLKCLENQYMTKVDSFLNENKDRKLSIDNIFNDSIESEIKLYETHACKTTL